jgi:hypothetical protein
MRTATGAEYRGAHATPELLLPETLVARRSSSLSPDVRCGHIESALANLILTAPFAQSVQIERLFSNLSGPLDYVVAVPARNEEGLLPRALGAIERTMREVPASGGVVVVVNNTTDRSFDITARFAAERELPLAAVQVTFAQTIRDAPHARRLALDLCATLAPEGVLLTSDADSYVGPLWARTLLANLAEGAALICEDVRLDETELANLPSNVRKVGDAERAYFEASELLWQQWTCGRGGTFAYRASGASMAVTTAAYNDIGGLPLPSSGEVAALCAAVLAAGHSAVQLRDLGTRTSARLEGRAAGGCGAALSHRASCSNPECDAALVPLAQLRARAKRFEAGLPPSGISKPMRYLEVVRELARARQLIGRAG